MNNVARLIRKGSGGNTARFDVVDAVSGGSFGAIDLRRSLIGGLHATWVAPNGASMTVTKGNILRWMYSIVDGTGKEIGRVRHKILAVRDVWQLEFESGANLLYSTIFATILASRRRCEAPGRPPSRRPREAALLVVRRPVVLPELLRGPERGGAERAVVHHDRRLPFGAALRVDLPMLRQFDLVREHDPAHGARERARRRRRHGPVTRGGR